jgi:hypothetical protein
VPVFIQEYCPAGKLWDLVKPLVDQQQQQQQQLPDSCSSSGAKLAAVGQPTGRMRPSPSFIIERQQAIALMADSGASSSAAASSSSDGIISEVASSDSEDSSDDLSASDISFVVAENSSLLGNQQMIFIFG